MSTAKPSQQAINAALFAVAQKTEFEGLLGNWIPAKYWAFLVQNHLECDTKIKGTKVRRTPTEEPNFYDPAWKSHFGASIPDHLKKHAFNSVLPSAPVAAKNQVSPRANPEKKTIVSNTAVLSAMPYVDILPAPLSKLDSVVPISDEESSSNSLDSLDLDALDSDLLMFEGNPFHYGLDISPAELEAVMSQSSAFVTM